MCSIIGFTSKELSAQSVRAYFDRTVSRGPDATRMATLPGAVWVAVGVLCLVPFVLRAVSAVCLEPQWDEGIRKQIPLRLDSIGIGVALAVMKLYHPKSYHKFFSRPACAPP